MARQVWVFPHGGGPSYLKSEGPPQAHHGILPDLPDFVSSVDGKTYSGRAGMREHNRLHNVVLAADLQGLPPLQTNSDLRSHSEQRRDTAERKEMIAHYTNQRLRDQL